MTAFGKRLFLPLPAAFLKVVPVLASIRVASRFVILYQLCAVCLAALGLTYLLNRLSPKARKRTLALILIALFVDLTYVPYSNSLMDFGGLYERIGQVPNEFTIMEVPFSLGDPVSMSGKHVCEVQHWRVAQIVHKKPIIGTIAARVDPSIAEKIVRRPVISAVVEAEMRQLTEETLQRLTTEVVQKDLAHFNLKLVIVHHRFLTEEEGGKLGYLFYHMGFRPIFTDGEVLVLETPYGPSLDKYVPEAVSYTHLRAHET